MEHDRLTDVMYVDMFDPSLITNRVEVIDVGCQVGFPGQVLARIDRDNGVLLGVTILDFSAFKRRMHWTYRMASIQRALLLFLNMLSTGFLLERRTRQMNLPI